MKLIMEMAYSKNDAIEICSSLGKRFLEHFDKIYNEPKSISRRHWETEMNSWWEKVKSIVLKQNNRKLSISNLHDWFFSAGENPIDFFTGEDKFEEEDVFDEFYLKLLSNRELDVRNALNNLI